MGDSSQKQVEKSTTNALKNLFEKAKRKPDKNDQIEVKRFITKHF